MTHDRLGLFQGLEVLNERGHSCLVSLFLGDVGHFNIEGDRGVVEHVFLLEVGQLLKLVKQVELLAEKVVALEVVYKLSGVDLRHCCFTRSLILRLVLNIKRLVFRLGVLAIKPLVANASAGRLPLEVEERVNGLDLYPPVSSFHRFAYEVGVVTRADDELIAVLHVSIFKRNL